MYTLTCYKCSTIMSASAVDNLITFNHCDTTVEIQERRNGMVWTSNPSMYKKPDEL